MEPSRTDLPRHIGAFTAGCVLVSNVVGSGIFTTTGFMARDLGHPGLILGLWLIGALIALAGALSYSELGAALPVTGGDYVYLRQAYGPFVGFLSGWASFTVGFGAAIAAGAVSFSAYFLEIVPLGPEHGAVAKGLALALVWMVTGFHLAGTGPGGTMQRMLTMLKIGALLLLILVALVVDHGNWSHLGTPAPDIVPSFGKAVVALIFALYAYSGWNAAAYLAGEIIDPARTIPRTMIGGTLFVGLLYLALNTIYFYVLPVTELAHPPILPVVHKVAGAMLGAKGATLVTVILCLSLAGAVSAMVWAGPRVYYAMARDRVIPMVFSRVSETSGVPTQAILLQSSWASLLVLTGTFEKLVIYSGVILTLFSALAVGAVVILRRRMPDLARPYRTPCYPLVPAFYLVAATVIVGYSALERPLETGLGLATVLAGTPFYFFWKKASGTDTHQA